LGDDVLVIVCVGGNASIVFGVGDAVISPLFPVVEVCFDPGMGEGTVGEEIGHAVIAVGGCIG